MRAIIEWLVSLIESVLNQMICAIIFFFRESNYLVRDTFNINIRIHKLNYLPLCKNCCKYNSGNNEILLNITKFGYNEFLPWPLAGGSL